MAETKTAPGADMLKACMSGAEQALYRNHINLIDIDSHPDWIALCMHDFWGREQYHPVLDFVDVVERVDQMGIFKPKRVMDLRRLGVLASQHLLDAR